MSSTIFNFDDLYMAQKSSTRHQQAENAKNLIRFFASFLKTGKFSFAFRSTEKLLKWHFPNSPNLVALYIMGYKTRNAALMNEVMRIIQRDSITYRKSYRQIWEATAEMCIENPRACKLRLYLLDILLLGVDQGVVTRLEIADSAFFPYELQGIFDLKWKMLKRGEYQFGFDRKGIEAYFYQFPEGEEKKSIQDRQAADSLFHNSVVESLKQIDSVGNTSSVHPSKLRALRKYISAFPNGHTLISTSPSRLLCGLDALSKTISAMHPHLLCPTVDDLSCIVEGHEYQTAAGECVLDNEAVNTNLFSVDQLAKILQIWGTISGDVFQLGYLTDDGDPMLVSCENEEEEEQAVVVWVHNDDAAAKFAKAVVAGKLVAFGTEVVGHWSGLKAKSIDEV